MLKTVKCKTELGEDWFEVVYDGLDLLDKLLVQDSAGQFYIKEDDVIEHYDIDAPHYW